MRKDLNITWLGHSCFYISNMENISIMFDPFKPGSVPNLKADYTMGVNKVFISHDHDDHNYDRIPCFLSLVDIPYETIEVAHDKENGKLRGMNKIHIVYLNDYKIVHMGDIGCKLTKSQINKLKDADVMFIPINGYYTISSLEALEIFKECQPKVMIPMHYYYNNSGYPDDDQLNKLIINGGDLVKTISEKSFDLKDYIKDTPYILVLDYKKEGK